MRLLFRKRSIKGYCFDKLILFKQIPLRIRCLKILLELVLKYMSKFIVKKRSSRGVLGNFEKFTGKHLCQSSFFNKVDGLRLHECFPVYFAKFLTLFVPHATSVNGFRAHQGLIYTSFAVRKKLLGTQRIPFLQNTLSGCF